MVLANDETAVNATMVRAGRTALRIVRIQRDKCAERGNSLRGNIRIF